MKWSLRHHRAQPLERFGINAGPEQREVADVAMDLAAGAAFRRHRLGLDHHLGDFFQAAAGGVAQPEDGVDDG